MKFPAIGIALSVFLLFACASAPETADVPQGAPEAEDAVLAAALPDAAASAEAAEAPTLAPSATPEVSAIATPAPEPSTSAAPLPELTERRLEPASSALAYAEPAAPVIEATPSPAPTLAIQPKPTATPRPTPKPSATPRPAATPSPAELPESPSPSPTSTPQPLPLDPAQLDVPFAGRHDDIFDVVFSREVEMQVAQLLEIPYFGTGWVFLGEMNSRSGLAYVSRRLDAEGQSFVFRAEKAGTYDLQFTRQDVVNNYIIQDFVRVRVSEQETLAPLGGFSRPTDISRVVAKPRWPENEASLRRTEDGLYARPAPAATPAPSATAAPAASADNASAVPADAAAAADGSAAAAATPSAEDMGASSVANSSTAAGSAESPGVTAPITRIPPPPPLPSNATVRPDIQDSGIVSTAPISSGSSATHGIDLSGTSEDALKRIQAAADSGRTLDALNALDELTSKGRRLHGDMVYFLYGRLYEANSPRRDIKKSFAYYRSLMTEYPGSSLYEDARRRALYLERFYLQIR